MLIRKRAPVDQPRAEGSTPAADGDAGQGTSRTSRLRIGGMPVWVFAAILAAVITAMFTDSLPPGMFSGFVVTMTMGWLLTWIGGRVPVLRDFGLPILLCVFGPALLVYAGLLPTGVIDLVTTFVDEEGFSDFVLIAVIAGAILGMPRALLINAGVRFAVPVVGTIAVVFVLIGVLGAALGYGFADAMLMIAAPIMAGGLPLGALPMSEMYGERLGVEASSLLGSLVSTVLLANIICILCASLLNGLGKRKARPFVGFNGDGKLLRIDNGSEKFAPSKSITQANLLDLGQGLLIAGTLLVAGTMLERLFPGLHAYAWTTLLAIAVKIFRLLPADLEDATSAWGSLATSVFVPPLLVAISIATIDISEILTSLGDPRFVILTVASVLLAGLTAGVLGWLVKFYFIEAAIAPGLVMADTGGSGDVAVLSACERMHLMPFATVANRVGGTLVLFVTSLLTPLLT
ncbi:2-hydroxycarboxylate transporter family protein [Streptomyces flaveus]|uniref:2-hydroxycarboxylate transporter family protein n=1 Tax=Streptomyces flaveus TaxID=66370 RepID=UPI00331D6B3A